ncbi:hypothetical protein JCM5350_002050 [Sporobolomyces pararoseus]
MPPSAWWTKEYLEELAKLDKTYRDQGLSTTQSATLCLPQLERTFSRETKFTQNGKAKGSVARYKRNVEKENKKARLPNPSYKQIPFSVLKSDLPIIFQHNFGSKRLSWQKIAAKVADAGGSLKLSQITSLFSSLYPQTEVTSSEFTKNRLKALVALGAPTTYADCEARHAAGLPFFDAVKLEQASIEEESEGEEEGEEEGDEEGEEEDEEDEGEGEAEFEFYNGKSRNYATRSGRIARVITYSKGAENDYDAEEDDEDDEDDEEPIRKKVKVEQED